MRGQRARTLLAASLVVALVAVCEAIPDGPPSDEGKDAYTKGCEACHGPEGKGGTAPALVPFTLELQELITIVRQGIGVMPGIPRDRVSDAEISAIRGYLINLEK